MNKNLAVSLPRIPRNSAEHLNKLDYSVFVHIVLAHLINSSDAS